MFGLFSRGESKPQDQKLLERISDLEHQVWKLTQSKVRKTTATKTRGKRGGYRPRNGKTIRERVLTVMAGTGRVYSAATLSKITGAHRQSIHAELSRLTQDKLIARISPGMYQCKKEGTV
jgi:hypothetical protein